MSRDDLKSLHEFLKPYPEIVQENTLHLRDWVWNLHPNTNELIYDNYNALAIGWSPTARSADAFCAIAVYGSGINFGFNRGSEIQDPKGLLKGNGKLYRYVKIINIKEFPKPYIKKLLKEAYINSIARLKLKKKVEIIKSQTIVKMALEKKRRPLI